MAVNRIAILFAVMLLGLSLFVAAGGTPDELAAEPAPTLTPQAYLPYVLNPFSFAAQPPLYLPNCALTQIRGTIMTETGNPLNGVTVRVWWAGADPDEIYSQPSGTYTNKPDGYWEVILAFTPKAGNWHVAVVDRDTGTAFSEMITVNTDVGPCQPGSEGKQVVLVDFVRHYGEHGTPASGAVQKRTQ